jgi:hypothetical protein
VFVTSRTCGVTALTMPPNRRHSARERTRHARCVARRMRFTFLFLGATLLGCSSATTVSTQSDASTPDPADAGSRGDDAGKDSAPAVTCPGPTPKQATAECQACQDAKCCITASAAAAKPGTWTNSAVLICRQDNCATECGTPAPTCGNITPSPASCAAALDKACCAQMAACGQSDECLALVYLCIDGQSCDPSAACFDACRKRYPNGAKLFDAMNACSGNVNCP